MEAVVLAALAEANRLRIVELLAAAPRTVGEIAATLDLRQPQVTKHLQTLGRAGLVEIHRLGRRRVCALRRPVLDALATWAAGLAVPGADDEALARYRAAVSAADTTADLTPVTVCCTVAASRTAVWRAFTDPRLAARWWHPRHFTVTTFRLGPQPGGEVELVLREGDGAEHRARGRVHAVDRLRRLAFTLDPLDDAGRPLFTARHDVRLAAVKGGTAIELTVTPSHLQSGAGAALGGIGIGWEQLLDNLAALTAGGGLTPAPGRAG
jgi:uncharacterized protein YndB with AHSA1/START domain/DNA-binding transcriptional ArsR family regulator